MLLDCGVRVSEACGLTVEGVDLDDGMALVKGTGSKVRSTWVPGPSARSTAISARAQERWAHLEALFITQRGALSRTVPAAASGCAERPPASTGFTRTSSGTPSPTTT